MIRRDVAEGMTPILASMLPNFSPDKSTSCTQEEALQKGLLRSSKGWLTARF
jgi:hypothetical protein